MLTRTSYVGRGALLGVIAAGALAGTARADTVNLNFVGNGSGRMVRASLGTQTWDVFAGRLIHHQSNGTASLNGPPSNIVTFCVDLLQGRASTPSQYSSSSLATLSGNTGVTNLGYAKQQAIYDIFHAAAGRQFTLGLDYACAFQVALWEVVYNYSPTAPNHGLSVTSGTFRVTAPGGVALSSSIMQKINFLFASIGTGSSAGGVVGLKSTPFQDQIYDTMQGQFVLAPIPASFWPGMAGLGLAAVIRWRKKRA